MSIATLKAELLRELAVAALGDTGHFQPIGAGTDLLNMMSGPPDRIRRAWVLNDRGPALIVDHVRDGSRIWLAPGTFPQTGNVSIVLTNVVHWTHDDVGVSRLCVQRDALHKATPFETEHMLLIPGPHHIGTFLENVLNGHVQDA